MQGYNIVWIDDSDDFIEGKRDQIIEYLGFTDICIKKYTSYDDFYKNEIEKSDKIIFSLYDLILVDYNLQSSPFDQSEKNGLKIITEIRGKEINTDIVFYSNEVERYIADIKNTLEKNYNIDMLDGVHYANRDNLVSQIKTVLSKNLKRELSIRNIRGMILDYTAEFDAIIINLLKNYYNRLSTDDKIEIVNLVKKLLKEQNADLTKKFDHICKLQDDKLFNEAIVSIDAILKVIDKYHIFSEVCLKLGFKSFDYDEYNNSIIRYRNKLAHKVINVCKRYKKLLIDNQNCKYECDDNKNCSNDNKFDIDCINELHDKLKFYYEVFKNLCSQN